MIYLQKTSNNTSDKMCWFFLRSYKYHIIK